MCGVTLVSYICLTEFGVLPRLTVKTWGAQWASQCPKPYTLTYLPVFY